MIFDYDSEKDIVDLVAAQIHKCFLKYLEHLCVCVCLRRSFKPLFTFQYKLIPTFFQNCYGKTWVFPKASIERHTSNYIYLQNYFKTRWLLLKEANVRAAASLFT